MLYMTRYGGQTSSCLPTALYAPILVDPVLMGDGTDFEDIEQKIGIDAFLLTALYAPILVVPVLMGRTSRT